MWAMEWFFHGSVTPTRSATRFQPAKDTVLYPARRGSDYLVYSWPREASLPCQPRCSNGWYIAGCSTLDIRLDSRDGQYNRWFQTPGFGAQFPDSQRPAGTDVSLGRHHLDLTGMPSPARRQVNGTRPSWSELRSAQRTRQLAPWPRLPSFLGCLPRPSTIPPVAAAGTTAPFRPHVSCAWAGRMATRPVRSTGIVPTRRLLYRAGLSCVR